MVPVNPLVFLVIYCIANFATVRASYCPNDFPIFDIGILPGQEVVYSHNRLRRLLNVPPLVWDEALARKAQNALLICDIKRGGGAFVVYFCGMKYLDLHLPMALFTPFIFPRSEVTHILSSILFHGPLDSTLQKLLRLGRMNANATFMGPLLRYQQNTIHS
ncbi:hypothetical protein F5H01DRAFT_143850 [Linnemannia elongata]|nr:hypothetical protein F5H01DRAFT_143850 [Linnemannia elongata]